MSDQRTAAAPSPIYLKDRNFAGTEYERQMRRRQSSLNGSAAYDAFDSYGTGGGKGGKGGTGNEKPRDSNNNGYPQWNGYLGGVAKGGTKGAIAHVFEIQDDLGMPVNYVRIKALEDNIRKDIVSEKNSLHRAISPVITIAHCLALLPIQGFKEPNTSYLVFNWFSRQIFCVFVAIVSCFVITTLSILRIYYTGLTYESLGEVLFYGGSVVIYILFIQLAKGWAKVMAKWELMEREMRHFRYTPNTAFKFKMITSIIMVFSIIERLSYVISSILKTFPCSANGRDIFRSYHTMAFRQVFIFVNYSIALGLPLEFLNFVLICAWNYMDLLIILLSCALSDKFKQLNQRLANVKGKVVPSTYWRKSRETYNLLASLTQDFDEFLSPVILMSFAHNLYFICWQLLNSLKPMRTAWEAVCFVFLFTYLVGRTCAVSLFAASINDQSKKPKTVLFSVPTESYGVEVARFLTQVTSDELALTGCNFFSVTRTFMLTIAGTIITYEIVLLQFNNVVSEEMDQNYTSSYFCS